MAKVLLKAKLQIPPTRPEQVFRPRLFERLDAGTQRNLTLISAPAGFGKTTLITAWVKGRNIPIAWFSLDKGDDQPECFWSYFIAALQTLESGIGENLPGKLNISPLPPIETILSELLNEIWEIRHPFIFVLDDYHVIENPHIQDGMSFLLDHLPPDMHLLVSTRADPPWPLARLRGRGEITELRIEDLRFSVEETTEFLNSFMGLALSREDVVALDERTEGWIVGLQMAALSMQGREDKSEFISAFTGSHRFILDYLAGEVLDRQPAELREFLLKTSIFDRLTGSLCDAVLCRSDSQSTLKQLEEANLFLIPLDDERRWYRYHHLFADILLGKLPQQFPNQMYELHRRASQWYARYGMLSEAANHAFMSGDIEYVAQLIEENALTVITIFSEHLPDLVAWLNALPDDLLHSRPWLIVARAWVLAYSGELDSAETVIQEIEQFISETSAGIGHSDLNREHLSGSLDAIRGYCLFMRGNIDCSVEWMEKAILRLPQADAPARIFSAVVLGAAIGVKGDLEGGIGVLSEAIRSRQEVTNPLLTVLVLSEMAGLQLLTGRIRQVIATCEEALHLSNEYYRLMGLHPPNVGFVYARLSNALREQNDLDTAIRYAQEAVKISRNWGQKDCLSISYSYLAQSLQSSRKAEDAIQMMSKAKQFSSELSSSVNFNTAAIEAKLHAGLGDLAFLSRWSAECGLSSDDELSINRAREYIVYARALLFQGSLDESLGLMRRLLLIAEAARAMLYEIELLILQAIALHAQGEVEQAMLPLGRALYLAEPEGYVRIFVDEGTRIQELLRQAVQRGLSSDYVSRLLAVLEDSLKFEGDKESGAVVQPFTAQCDVLTRREIEILKMLMTPRSVREISVELSIATSTLRTHLRNIYDKLGIHSRMEAVAIARELNIR